MRSEKTEARFVGYHCRTSPESGFAGKKNGELLMAAERAGFDVLVTTDKGLEYEQNFKDRRVAVLILLSKSNKVDDLSPLVAKSLHTLPFIRPGQILKVG